MEQSEVTKVLQRWEKLKGEKSSWNNMYQEVVDYVLPNRQSFTGTATPGKPTSLRQYDSTATWALDQLAAGLHSYLTSATQRWVKFRLPEELEETLGQDDDVIKWLEDSSNIVYNMLNTQRSNFNTQAHELYIDVGGFGTAVMYCEEGDDFPFRFSTYHLSKVSIAEDSRGQVDELYREYDLSANECVERFGKKCPEEIIKKAAKDGKHMFRFVHAVYKRYKRENLPDAKNMPYASCTIWVDKKIVVNESGYLEFPYQIPRWSKLCGETYGRSPAIMAMPDIRVLNAMAKTVLRAGQKIVDPPITLPDEGYLMPINQNPGGLSYFNSTLNPELLARPLNTGGRVDIGQEMMKSRQNSIMRSFYANWMQTAESPQKTATQVMQETEERMRMMSPAVSRLQAEFLDPLIERVFGILLRRGYLPKPPDQLRGVDIRAEYVSPVARAQQMNRVTGVQRLLESIGQIAPVKPEIADKLDSDGLLDFFAESFDVTYKILLPDAQVKQIRAQRAEAQAKAAQSQGLNVDADTANKMSGAAKNMETLQ
jgi:hypothetical protein